MTGPVFSVDLPAKGWNVVLDRPAELKLQLQGLPLFLELEARYLQPDQEHASLQALARANAEPILRGFEGAHVAEEGPALVGGRPGWRLSIVGRSSGLPVQALELSARDGPRLYQVGLVGAEQLVGRGTVAWRRAADTLVAHERAGDVPPHGAAALAASAERALTVERDPDKAAALYARAVAADGRSAVLRQRLLEAELAAGLAGRAVAQLRAELRADPGRFDRWALLGALEAERGRTAEAVAALEEAGKRPGCPVEIYKSLGSLLMSQHRPPEAVRAFRAAADKAPADAAIFTALGEAYLQSGDLDQAQAAEEQAAQLDPAAGEIHAILSEIEGDRNHYQAAIAECLAALQRDIPKKLGATLRYNLACYQARLGHQRECLWWLRQALEAGFDDFDLLKNDPDLASVRGTPAFRELFGQ